MIYTSFLAYSDLDNPKSKSQPVHLISIWYTVQLPWVFVPAYTCFLLFSVQLFVRRPTVQLLRPWCSVMCAIFTFAIPRSLRPSRCFRLISAYMSIVITTFYRLHNTVCLVLVLTILYRLFSLSGILFCQRYFFLWYTFILAYTP